MPSPSDLTPNTDPPFFFRRVYHPTGMDEVMVVQRTPNGRLFIQTDVPQAEIPEELRDAPMEDLAPDGLVIYGRAIWPNSAEDRDVIRRIYRPRGQVFAQCFSVNCTDGEVGTHPLATVTEISREEFEQARARGWA